MAGEVIELVQVGNQVFFFEFAPGAQVAVEEIDDARRVEAAVPFQQHAQPGLVQVLLHRQEVLFQLLPRFDRLFAQEPLRDLPAPAQGKGGGQQQRAVVDQDQQPVLFAQDMVENIAHSFAHLLVVIADAEDQDKIAGRRGRVLGPQLDALHAHPLAAHGEAVDELHLPPLAQAEIVLGQPAERHAVQEDPDRDLDVHHRDFFLDDLLRRRARQEPEKQENGQERIVAFRHVHNCSTGRFFFANRL